MALMLSDTATAMNIVIMNSVTLLTYPITTVVYNHWWQMRKRRGDRDDHFTAIIQLRPRQPAPPVKKWRTSLKQSFTARMSLLKATSTKGSVRRQRD